MSILFFIVGLFAIFNGAINFSDAGRAAATAVSRTYTAEQKKKDVEWGLTMGALFVLFGLLVIAGVFLYVTPNLN